MGGHEVGVRVLGEEGEAGLLPPVLAVSECSLPAQPCHLPVCQTGGQR